MSETQQVQNSTVSIPSSDKTEDTLTKVKVNEETMDEPSLFPDRPGERDCHYFLRTGKCGYGSSCRYNHPASHVPDAVFYHREELPERIGQPDCEYYLKTGACKYGATCKYHHPKDRNGAGPVLFNALGYPMRQGEKSCPYYMQKGMCRFGVACKFHHPQTHQTHNAQPASFPSVGFTYAGGLPVMSMPPATYGVMDRPQVTHPQTYLPFMVAPPQGWSTYMAGSNPIYDGTTEIDSSSEKAECRFFMKTGTCKYGDNCKYSHPKERMLLSPPNLLNLMVLPARPGQPACGNFKAYGFCKYGASCKFDHPVPVNPDLTMPSLPPTAYAPPVSTPVKITSPPSRSNGDKPAAENQSSEIEKPDDGPDKPEVQDSSQLSHSDSTALSNDAEKPSPETKKEDDDPSPADNSGKQDSSDNAA